MNTFFDKVAAITGAGSGMGRALAHSLASQGCHVALSDVNQVTLDETAAGITNSAVKVTTHLVNVAQRADVEQFAADVVEQHGRVNMVFNNAGVSVTDTAEHMSYADFEWLMNINFWGVVYGTKSFLPYLHQVDDAHVINTSSIFGNIAVPTQSAYNASKFAVKGFTFALSQELADTHINVSCVQPGGVKTNIVKESRYVPSDNSAPTQAEFIARFEELAGLTPDQAAEQILRGVRKNRKQILVGRDARIAALLERVLPVRYMRLIGSVMSADEV